MKKENLIEKLLAKKELIERDLHKYDDRVKMSRTLLFSTLKNEVRSYRKLAAIDCAVSLINGAHIFDIDCRKLVMDCMSTNNVKYEDLYMKAESIYLSERKEVIRSVMELSLPICKKQVMEYI